MEHRKSFRGKMGSERPLVLFGYQQETRRAPPVMPRRSQAIPSASGSPISTARFIFPREARIPRGLPRGDDNAEPRRFHTARRGTLEGKEFIAQQNLCVPVSPFPMIRPFLVAVVTSVLIGLMTTGEAARAGYILPAVAQGGNENEGITNPATTEDVTAGVAPAAEGRDVSGTTATPRADEETTQPSRNGSAGPAWWSWGVLLAVLLIVAVATLVSRTNHAAPTHHHHV